jgi:Rod binding domain-containing protein
MLYVDPLSASNSARLAPEAAAGQRRETAFKELEHYFAQTLLQEMRKTIPENSMFGSSEMKTYEEFLDDALGAQMADSGQLGIAAMLEQQLRIEEMQRQLQGKLDEGLDPHLGEMVQEIEQSRVQASMPISGAGSARAPLSMGGPSGGQR